MSTIRIDNQASTPPEGPGSLRELFEQEEGPLLRYAVFLVGRRAVAEEIVQEVFLALHDRWNEVDSPRAWLFRSVRNRAFNHNRDRGRLVVAGDEGQSPAAAADDEGPEALLAKREAVGGVRLLIEELNEEDRLLIKLKYFENLKYREISERTGLSAGNVGYRLHHLLKRLAERLRRLGIDGVP